MARLLNLVSSEPLFSLFSLGLGLIARYRRFQYSIAGADDDANDVR